MARAAKAAGSGKRKAAQAKPAAEQKKILILGNLDSGFYDFRRELALALLQDGYGVHLSVPDTGYVERLRAMGCVCHETALDRRGMNPGRDLKLFGFYLRLIRKIRPSAVLTYTIKPNIYGGLVCRLTRTPYLANITGLGTALEHGGALQKMLILMYREGLKAADRVFFQNRQNREFMVEKGCVRRDAPGLLLPGSGVNLEGHPFREYPAGGEILFLSVMRIMKDKGIEELLTAAETIHREHPEAVFGIAGAYEEECRSVYEPRIGDLQEKGVVRYYGYRDDMNALYEDCHALIHPSYHEGMSNVMQEAAATGRPVIASDISGCREIFEDGISGIAFRPGDAGSLTAALRSFLSLSAADRASMGRRARAHVEQRFDRRQVVEAYLEAIRAATG